VRARTHALLVAPALIFFAPALFFARALYVRDTGLYFYPHKAWIAAVVRSLRLPQWSPAEFGGLPILADPNFNTFHPFALFTNLLPLPWGFQVFVFAAALFAAYGAYWAGRELGLSEAASVVCAWAFAWSGPFVSLIQSGQLLAPASVPALFATAVRLRRTGERRDLLLVSAAAALLFLSGTPEIAAAGFVLALVLSGRQAPRFLTGCALGAGLAAVQLLPTAAFARESSRGMGFGPEPAFRLLRVPALVVPLFDGWLDAPGRAYWTFDGTPWVEAVYLGVVMLFLAAFGARRQWPVLLAALGFACLASTPGFAAGRALLPPLRDIRFGDKFIVPLAMAVPLAAAEGYDRLRARKQWLWAALGVAALALAAFLVAPSLSVERLGPRAAECLRATALRATPLELGLLAAALAAAAYGRKLALAALLALDLALPAAVLDRTVPAAEVASQSPLAARLADAGREYRVDVHSAGMSEEDAEVLGAPDWLRTRRLLAMRRFALYAPGSGGDVLLMRGYSGFPSGPMRELYGKGDLSALSVLFGVEFGSGGRSPYRALGFTPAGVEGPVRIFRNERALPRVRRFPGGEAKLTFEQDDDLRIQTSGAAPGHVFLADTMASGWTATVDGEPARPLPGALRVVDVPAGQHEVRWRYRAPGLLAGAFVSLLSLGLFALLWRQR
jgi:hypothetical protein